MFEIGEVEDLPDFRAQEDSEREQYWDNVEAIVAAMQSYCITDKQVDLLLSNAGLARKDVVGVKFLSLSTIEQKARRAA